MTVTAIGAGTIAGASGGASVPTMQAQSTRCEKQLLNQVRYSSGPPAG